MTESVAKDGQAPNDVSTSPPPSFTPYARGNILLHLSYLVLFSFWGASYYYAIPVSINLITTSTLIIFIGSHRSLALIEKGSDGKAVVERETLSKEDAYRFPLVGGVSLSVLYAAFKYLDKETVNLMLSFYFALVGTFTLTSTLSPFISNFVPGKSKYGPAKFQLPVLGSIDLRLTASEIVSLVPSMVFSWFYFKTKHYMLNNILGISFCVQAIEKVSIGSYMTGAILLVGLFFYDIFFVFFTPFMVTVAKNLDGPIKLLFPRVLAAEGVKAEFSLLGLGDIVIPGLFIALLLRLDADLARVDPKTAEYAAFPKPYFFVNVAFYALGLLVTVGVMYFFNHAQPALLYLVPACLLGSLLVGLVRGQINTLFAYNEEEPAVAKTKKED